jgi:hypothetical protein
VSGNHRNPTQKKSMSSLNRRHFLQQTGLGTGALLIVIGFPASVRGQNLNSRINVAGIGVGGQGDVDAAAKCSFCNKIFIYC